MRSARFRWLASVLACLVVHAAPVIADEAGDAPVNFSLERLGGGTVALTDYRGGWVVVNYWATWCAPCRKEMPELSELHRERDDVTVLGLAFEDLEDADFYAFLEDFPVSYPVLKVDVYDPPQPFGAPKVLPTTIILDPQGYAVKTFFGPVTGEAIEGFIDGEG
jgi:thiol-disulfide isomerase/thioredoxin